MAIIFLYKIVSSLPIGYLLENIEFIPRIFETIYISFLTFEDLVDCKIYVMIQIKLHLQPMVRLYAEGVLRPTRSKHQRVSGVHGVTAFL